MAMSGKKAPRLRIELALAYLLPLPPLAAGLIWAVLFSSISWLVANYNQTPLIFSDKAGALEPTTDAVLLFVASLMLGMLPAILRMSLSSEEWERQPTTRPVDFKKRWRIEKELLPAALPTARELLPMTILGAVIGFGINSWIIGHKWASLHQHPTMAWAVFQLWILFMLLARGAGYTHFGNRRRKPIYEAADDVDLSDLTPQYRAARCALRSGMTWLAGASLSSLFFQIDDSRITIGVLSVVTIIATLSLLPPILRLKNRIRLAKSVKLELLRKQLNAMKPSIEASMSGQSIASTETRSAQPGELADLLSYLHYLESLPEWPFDKNKIGTISLYFAVPLGSWLWITAIQKLLSLTIS
jgi:hypothetical protein